MRKLILAATLALMPSLAMAQADRVREPAVKRTAPALTGNPVADVQNAIKGNANSTTSSAALSPDQLWQKIINANVLDLTYAKALADNVQSAGSKLRSACYGAILTTVQQANGINLKDGSGNALTQPDPHIISDFEKLAQIADNLQATSPLMAACSPVATAVKQDVTQLIAVVVGGGASLAMLGISIP